VFNPFALVLGFRFAKRGLNMRADFGRHSDGVALKRNPHGRRMAIAQRKQTCASRRCTQRRLRLVSITVKLRWLWILSWLRTGFDREFPHISAGQQGDIRPWLRAATSKKCDGDLPVQSPDLNN